MTIDDRTPTVPRLSPLRSARSPKSSSTTGRATSALMRRLSQRMPTKARISAVKPSYRYGSGNVREEQGVRILLVGAGGVGGAVTRIAARRPFFEALVVADYDVARAEKAVAATGDARFTAARVDASDEDAVRALLAEHRCDVLLNATDPRFVMPLFRAA